MLTQLIVLVVIGFVGAVYGTFAKKKWGKQLLLASLILAAIIGLLVRKGVSEKHMQDEQTPSIPAYLGK